MKAQADIVAETLRDLLDFVDRTAIIAALLRLEPELDERIRSALTEAEQNARDLPALWRYCATMPMSGAPDLGYNPLRSILAGEKQHTIRNTATAPGRLKEVTAPTRAGIVLRFGEHWPVEPEVYTSDDFAVADGVHGAEGIPPGEAMRLLFARFYGEDKPLGTMICNSFEVHIVEAKAVTAAGLLLEDLPDTARVVHVSG